MGIKNLLLSIIFLSFISGSVVAQNYSILNDATVFSGCNCYQLTPDLNTQGGGVYHNSTISLANSFDYTFSVYLGCRNGGGADGIVFILTDNITGIGIVGGGLGYGGLTGNSVGIEFDTYQNGWDPFYHHIAIETGGQVQHPVGTIAGPVSTLPSQGSVDDCAWHLVRIIWDVPTLTYSVYFDGVFRTSYTGDIVTNFFAGNPIVNWGWSGSTGGLTNQQIVCVQNSSTWTAGANYASCHLTIPFVDSTTSNVSNIVSWAWDFGDPNSGARDTTSKQNPIHSYSAAGAYVVKLVTTDDSGCTDTIAHTVNIDSIVPTPSPTEPLCNGTATGSITLSIAGATASETVTWSNSGTGTTISGLAAGTYHYTINDSIGCTHTDSVILSQPTQIVPSITRVDSTCFGLCTGIIYVSASAGTGPYQYALAGGSFSATDSFPGLCADQPYKIYIRDNNGCLDSISQAIVELAEPTLAVVPNDSTIFYGDTIQLYSQFGPASLLSSTQYIWTDTTNKLTCINCSDPRTAPIDSVNYYTLTVNYNNNLCSVSFTDIVKVAQGDTFAIPNAFTPNGDGINDTYFLQANNVKSFHMDIFNRWGETVFSTNDISTAWDGTYKGKPQPTGAYTLYFNMQYGKDRNISRTASFMLLR